MTPSEVRKLLAKWVVQIPEKSPNRNGGAAVIKVLDIVSLLCCFVAANEGIDPCHTKNIIDVKITW